MITTGLKSFAKTYIPGARVVHRWSKDLIDDMTCSYAVVSFFKCGHTWLRVMLAKILQEHFQLSSMKLDLANMTYFRPHAPNIAVTHANSDSPFSTCLKIRRSLRRKKIILLVRDPCDVVVSYYHEITKRHDTWHYQHDLSTFIREEISLQKIVRFVNMWIEEQERRPESILLVRYEDMRHDTRRELDRILAFLQLEVDEQIIDNAVDFGSFDNMRKLEQANAFDDSRLKTKNEVDENSRKVRKGKVGGYREELSVDDRRFVEDYVREHLHPQLGYAERDRLATVADHANAMIDGDDDQYDFDQGESPGEAIQSSDESPLRS